MMHLLFGASRRIIVMATRTGQGSGKKIVIAETHAAPTDERGRRDVCRRVSPWVRPEDRKSVVQGKSVSVRVDLCGRRIIKKKQHLMSETDSQLCPQITNLGSFYTERRVLHAQSTK